MYQRHDPRDERARRSMNESETSQVVTGLHHVGHVTASAADAAAAYGRLGFVVPAFEFPAVASGPNGQLRSFGVGNTHIAFAGNFVELVALATGQGGEQESYSGEHVTLAPIELPPDAAAPVAASIETLVNRLSGGLERGQPLQILVLETA